MCRFLGVLALAEKWGFSFSEEMLVSLLLARNVDLPASQRSLKRRDLFLCSSNVCFLDFSSIVDWPASQCGLRSSVFNFCEEVLLSGLLNSIVDSAAA